MATASGQVQPAVGCRVRIVKDFATVRYVGPVAKQEGVWVGVEWDDPSRGKHDGSTGGVKYFECASAVPTAGSFVRLEKVCFGVTVLEALLARYQGRTGEFGGDVTDDQLYVHTSRKRRVRVELVGEAQIQRLQSQVHLLASARLVGMDVAAVVRRGRSALLWALCASCGLASVRTLSAPGVLLACMCMSAQHTATRGLPGCHLAPPRPYAGRPAGASGRADFAHGARPYRKPRQLLGLCRGAVRRAAAASGAQPQ